MKILITYAAEAEFAPWLDLLKFETETVNGLEVRRTQLARATVDFVITGMGAANAQRVAEAVLSGEYSFCIVSGFAGALQSSVKLGDIVAPQKIQRDRDSSTILAAPNLVSSAAQDGAVSISTLLTADHVVSTADEKQRLSVIAEAVDMESFTILSVARTKNLPAAVIRVISDSFDANLPVDIDTMLDSQGNVKLRGVVRYVKKHPLAVPALMRLGRESKTAAEALAHFLEAYLKKLTFSTQGLPPSELQQVAAS
jgi:nucleoside phosphorylase